MGEITQTVLLLFIALVFLILGCLNLRGRFVDALPAGENGGADDNGSKLARAVGYFAVSLFCIWRAFNHEPLGGTVFAFLLTYIVLPGLAAGVLVVPVLKWYRRRRRDKAVMAQIIAEAALFVVFFIFSTNNPEGRLINNFGTYFNVTLLLVFLVICLYRSRRFGLSIAMVLGLLIPAVIPADIYPYVILVRVGGTLAGAAAAYGLDYVITRCFRETICNGD